MATTPTTTTERELTLRSALARIAGMATAAAEHERSSSALLALSDILEEAERALDLTSAETQLHAEEEAAFEVWRATSDTSFARYTGSLSDLPL